MLLVVFQREVTGDFTLELWFFELLTKIMTKTSNLNTENISGDSRKSMADVSVGEGGRLVI